MSQRRTIGDILLSTGRITEADVQRALDYQREHGGFFGEALVACRLLSAEEVEWGLASQYDLPYVFPEADSVDYDAASLVTPEWALANLTLPIMKTDEALSVIVDSPLKTEALGDLAARVDVAIEIALASPGKIRELIRQVYARGTAADEDGPGEPLELSRALDKVLEASAPRFGVSVRGTKVWVWWDDVGAVRRAPLVGDWRGELDGALDPPPSKTTGGRSRAEWVGQLSRAGTTTPVAARFLADESGSELLFHPSHGERVSRRRYPDPPAGVVSEVRLLARSGKARFVVTTDPLELGHDILPHLPELLLDPSWRSLYIHAGDRGGEAEAFSRRLPADPDTWSVELDALRAFRFDVVTVDLEDEGMRWTASALDVASVAFVLWAGSDVTPAHEAGLRWQLHLAGAADDGLEWELTPLRV